MQNRADTSVVIERYRQAIRLEPGRAELQVSLGACLADAGQLEEAVNCYREALALDPGCYQAYNNLGRVFASLGDRRTALTFFEAALRLQPELAAIHHNLGSLYQDEGKIEAAIASYKKAIEFQPEEPVYWNQLGNALRVAGRHEEAEASMRKALSLRPEYAEAYVNLGMLFYEQEKVEQAEDAYHQAIKKKPDLAIAHTFLAWLLLRRGDLREGWREQEWRWKWEGFLSPRRHFERPQWRGEPIEGARIFLHAEQGLGDTLQFLRYVPLVAARGAQVTLEVHKELKGLAASLAGATELIARGEAVAAFDWHCPLLSLPLAFSTELESIPAEVPYLHADLQKPVCAGAGDLGKLKVGLCWAGNPKSGIDLKRSLSLAALGALGQIDAVAFYSLQRGVAGSNEFHFAGAIEEDGDFAATAALVAGLDLVITVDTSIAHLAGALGRPVWILLPKLADWRWLREREDSPWYPTARLFRQGTGGEWKPVIDRVVAELCALAASKAT